MVSQRDAWEMLYSSHSEGLWDESADILAEKLCSEYTGGSILEIGCGDGRNMGRLIELNPCGGIVAVDQCSSALNICRKRFGYPKGLTLVCGKIEDKIISYDEFTSVLCVDVLGHVENIDAVVNLIYNSMKKNSRLYTSLYSPKDVAFTEEEGVVNTNQDNGSCICSEQVGIRYYGRSKDEVRRIFSRFNVLELELREWKEPPHGSFRKKEHLHSSWSLILEK